ncbi:MAG: type 4a pilus biogenesis protein PilO [Pirellulales bacterium]|nr:type 4a pilus biogenesis protein PilO [Pirellulales bacterium]
MKSAHKPTSWFITVPLAGLTAAYVVLAFLPTEKAIGRVREATIEKQRYCTATGNLLPLLETTRQHVEKTREFTQTWAETAPNRSEVAALAGTVDALVRAAGARITMFDPEPVTRRERVSELSLKVGCTGTFPQVFAFVHELETLPQTVWVKSLVIEREGKEGGSVHGEVNVVVFLDNSEVSN